MIDRIVVVGLRIGMTIAVSRLIAKLHYLVTKEYRHMYKSLKRIGVCDGIFTRSPH